MTYLEISLSMKSENVHYFYSRKMKNILKKLFRKLLKK